MIGEIMSEIKVFESSKGDLFSFTDDESNGAVRCTDPEPTSRPELAPRPVKDFFKRQVNPVSTVVYWMDQNGAARYWDKANPGLWCIVYPVNHPNLPAVTVTAERIAQ